MAGIVADIQDPPAQVSEERQADPIPTPVSLDDISGILTDTAWRDGVLQPTDRPDVFAVDTGSGTALRITPSRDIFETENMDAPGDGSDTGCEFASYGGSGFESLLALLPETDDLPGWMCRIEVEATEGGVTLTRTAYVVSCKDGDRTVLSLRALNDAEIDPNGTPSRAFVASLERYLKREIHSELRQIGRVTRIEKANLDAALRQRAFALEIAAALTQQTAPARNGLNIGDSIETIAGRRHPMLVTLDRARLFRQSPNLFDVVQAVPDEGRLCLSAPPALLLAAASEISAMPSEQSAGIDPERLCHEVDRLLEATGL